MTIAFDWEIKSLGGIPIIPVRDEAKDAHYKMKKFIRSRLSILSDEIEKYPEGIHGFSLSKIFCIKIEHNEYPEPLLRKMKDSISDDDLNFIIEFILDPE